MAKVCPDVADEPQEDPDDEVLPEATSSLTQHSSSTSTISIISIIIHR